MNHFVKWVAPSRGRVRSWRALVDAPFLRWLHLRKMVYRQGNDVIDVPFGNMVLICVPPGGKMMTILISNGFCSVYS